METTDYCSYELSKALIEAGCYYNYNDVYYKADKSLNDYRIANVYQWEEDEYIPAISLWYAQKWLREKKGIAINADAHYGDFYTWEAVFLSNAAQDALIEASLSAKFSPYVEKYGSYERALSAGISAALELIKKGE